jgi:SAM-dependent methyltransferase
MPHDEKLLNFLRRILPQGVKRFLRPFYPPWLDLLDFIQRRSRRGLPPSRLMVPQYGSRRRESFEERGAFMAERIIRLCSLAPQGRFLDVGCGAGRVAIALAPHLSQGGRYDGLDVDRKSIAWATRNLSSRHPCLHFHFADAQNAQYNPAGRASCRDYRFPFEDGAFDAVYLYSVFTHMRPEDLKRYFSEIARVLKPGGKMYATYFLLDDTISSRLEDAKLAFNFQYDFGLFRSINREVPEFTLAYPEAFVRALHQERGLTVMEPIYKGSWRGCAADCFQDEVLAVRD